MSGGSEVVISSRREDIKADFDITPTHARVRAVCAKHGDRASGASSDRLPTRGKRLGKNAHSHDPSNITARIAFDLVSRLYGVGKYLRYSLWYLSSSKGDQLVQSTRVLLALSNNENAASRVEDEVNTKCV